MNVDKLKAAEGQFLQLYPLGFNDPEMVKMGNKHKLPQMIEKGQQGFSQSAFKDRSQVAEDMVKLTSQSSLVSLFEKPKFRDHVKTLTAADRNRLVDAFYQRIHGEAQEGFEAMVTLLKPAKLAKWSLISVLPYYLGPDTEVFVKPTTAKGVIAHFEVPDLVYHPTPTWSFYLGYQKLIKEMKTHTAQSLKPNNAAFCGFLMMSMK